MWRRDCAARSASSLVRVTPGSASSVSPSTSWSIADSWLTANATTPTPSPITTRNALTSLVPILRLLNQFIASCRSIGALRRGARRARACVRGLALRALVAARALAVERELRDQLLEIGGHARELGGRGHRLARAARGVVRDLGDRRDVLGD